MLSILTSFNVFAAIAILLASIVISRCLRKTTTTPPSNSTSNLPELLIVKEKAPEFALQSGKYQWGRFKQPINNPNVHARSFFGDIFGSLRLKKWHYHSVTTKTHMVALAVVQLHYVSNAWCYVVDLKHPEKIQEFRILSPLGAGVIMSHSSCTGTTSWKKGDKYITITSDVKGFKVDLNLSIGGKPLKGVINVNTEKDHSLALLYPLAVHLHDGAKSRAAYTHKMAGVQASGSITLGDEVINLDNGLACMDWTRSFALRQTHWKWTNFATYIADEKGVQHRVGVNFSSGVYQEDTENVVFVDGVVHPVGLITHEKTTTNNKHAWQVSNADKAINLTFNISSSKEEHVNALIIKDDFIQHCGVYNGVLRVGEHTLNVKNAFGVFEQHSALW